MLRLLRTKPGHFRPGLLQRLQTRPSTRRQPDPDQIQLQRVKVRRKWFRPWAFAGAFVVYYTCYQLYTTSVFGVLGKWLDQEFAKMSPKERRKLEKELAEEDTALYIPLPGTTKLVESPPYKGTDPEWKQFAKLSRDPQKIQSIKASLAEYCKKAIEKHPQISHDFGPEWKITRAWLDVAYPQRPPPAFERQALCWDEDSLSVVSQPVDSDTVFKLERTLMPTAMTLSMWSFSVALAKHNFYNVAKQFGYEPRAEQVATVQQTLDRIRQHMEKPPSSRTPGSVSDPTSLDAKPDTKDEKAMGPTKRQTADGSTDSAPSPPPSSGEMSDSTTGGRFPGPISPFSKSQESADGKQPSAKDVHGVREVSGHTAGAWQALRQKWQQVWKPKKPFPPRGSVKFSGLVEVASPKASLVVDVLAWYDPKTNSVDGKTLRLALRAIKPRQMSPAPSR
ncbi:hypothetical protein BKA67DRAFT_186298 [Truncatella angustata]|uniref:Uncharacterized protein n=1 Tax=Truncatella angustata TaxID=152316 RepID=A0A9P8ZZJ7_9PEZI|nr:uncharacterized protein BKA67DRAFT_186298 [Truncatella angustata]KAH6657332.1 hypothetical protein BKA67DRAFT_186298 [Truncatella angustata]